MKVFLDFFYSIYFFVKDYFDRQKQIRLIKKDIAKVDEALSVATSHKARMEWLFYYGDKNGKKISYKKYRRLMTPTLKGIKDLEDLHLKTVKRLDYV
jgi:hypothetical protein